MILVVAEDPNNAITDFMQSVRALFPVSSTFRVHKDNITSALDVVKGPPMLSPNWLTIINIKRMSDSQLIKLLSYEENVNIIHTSMSSEFDDIKLRLSSLDISYQYVDNLHPSKKVIIDYIVSELDTSEALAKFIAKRCGYYIPRIYEHVSLLASSGIDITKENIRKYTNNYGTASIITLVEHVIGYDTAPQKAILSLLNNYRYSVKYLFQTLKTELDNILIGYDHILTGQLSYNNYTDFKVDNLSLSEYKLRKILNYFSCISYERVYFIKCLAENETNYTIPNLFKFIKSGGEV